MQIILRYRSRRAEVWRWYWRCWLRPHGLWRYHAALFVAVAGMVLWATTRFQAFPPRILAVAILLGLASIAWLPLWPLLRFKSSERMLNLDESGASTTIGAKSGEVLWRDVARIDEAGNVIAITARAGNAFLIPDRAFATAAERAAVLATMTAWHRAANPCD
jgi:hypothetical protein